MELVLYDSKKCDHTFHPLPVDICEHIIDACWDTFYHATLIDLIEQYRTLTSCVLVCRAWLPRSRMNLYTSIWFSCAGDAELFARTLEDNPWVGGFTRELSVRPPSRYASLGRVHPGEIGYIPFAQGSFLRHLRNLHTISLHVELEEYPPNYIYLLRNFAITRMEFVGQLTSQNGLALIQRLPRLSVFTFHWNLSMSSAGLMALSQPPTEWTQGSILGPQTDVFRDLRSLKLDMNLHHNNLHRLFRHGLGCAVQHLNLTLYFQSLISSEQMYKALADLAVCISRFLELRTLSIDCRYNAGLEASLMSGCEFDDNNPPPDLIILGGLDNACSKIVDVLVYLLRHGRALKTLKTLRLKASGLDVDIDTAKGTCLALTRNEALKHCLLSMVNLSEFSVHVNFIPENVLPLLYDVVVKWMPELAGKFRINDDHRSRDDSLDKLWSQIEDSYL